MRTKKEEKKLMDHFEGETGGISFLHREDVESGEMSLYDAWRYNVQWWNDHINNLDQRCLEG